MTKNPGNPGLPQRLPPPSNNPFKPPGYKPPRNIFHGHGVGSGGGSGSRPTEPQMMPMAVMNFPGPAGGGPSIDSDWGPPNYPLIETGTMAKGINWEVWKNAILARGVDPALIIEATTGGYNSIQFRGQAAIHFFSMFDIAFVGHAPPLGYVQAIKNVSRVGTKVGTYFANFESVGHDVAANDWWHTAEAVSMTRLRNTGIVQGAAPGANPNSACTFADQFQLTQPPAPAACGTQVATGAFPHTWICDITIADYKTNWFNAMISAILTRYGVGGLDYMLVDNVLERPNWLEAVNVDATYTDANYVAGWKAMWALADQFLLSVAGTRLVGNCAQTSAAYSNTEVHRRYCEHFFHDEQTFTNTTSEDESVIHSRLTSGASQNLRMLHHQIRSNAATYNARSYGATHVDNWSGTANGPGGTKGTWSGLLSLARQLGILSNFYAVAARSGTTFPIFWQDSFRRPV